jgi:hypothetical protein
VSLSFTFSVCAWIELPGSYKLWKMYLDERRRLVEELPLDHPQYEAMNATYERALVFMHKVGFACTDRVFAGVFICMYVCIYVFVYVCAPVDMADTSSVLALRLL